MGQVQRVKRNQDIYS